MPKSKDAWEQFEKTGHIEAYLEYCRLKKRDDEGE